VSLVKYNNNSISAVTSASSIPSGALVPIKTLTASSSATLSFVDGSSDVVLDSTYPIYVFKFISLHPATDNVLFQFNMSVDSGSNYNVAKTTTHFDALHNEEGSASGLTYRTGNDLAQGTGFKTLVEEVGGDNDQNCSGEMFLFNPSSTTFVKHFLARFNNTRRSNYSADHHSAGYGNTTSAVDAVQFKMSSGNIDSGTIKLYGIKDS
jgi:hypothetical protein